MKQLLVTDVLGDDGHVIGNKFADSCEIDLVGSNVLKVADASQCVLLNTDSFATIVLRPVDKDTCGPDCGCHDKVTIDGEGDLCQGGEKVGVAGEFDCGGACKNRCYECGHQYNVIKGEDHEGT